MRTPHFLILLIIAVSQGEEGDFCPAAELIPECFAARFIELRYLDGKEVKHNF
jgi:hypothetical protein